MEEEEGKGGGQERDNGNRSSLGASDVYRGRKHVLRIRLGGLGGV